MDNLRPRPARTPGELALKVDHAGEHGAICIYRAQRWIARWRAPAMLAEIEEFLTHEERHRALFGDELGRRGIRRCRSFHLCGLGGLVLGFVTGLLGTRAIALTTEAVESVVLSHLEDQLRTLGSSDPVAAVVIGQIVADEQDHHDRSEAKIYRRGIGDRLLGAAVRASTEAVIWVGMRPVS